VPGDLLPLFPLSHVLLPSMPLPLHIFEPRYRQLVLDIGSARGLGSFGVVALRRGAEVGDAEPDVEQVGTIAEIVELETNEDGTSDLLTVGSRRFRVERLIPDQAPYLQAEVSFLSDRDPPVPVELESHARALMFRYDETLRRVAGRGTGGELPDDAGQLSWHLAGRLPLEPPDRQLLLTDATSTQRLARLVRLMRREGALLRLTRTIAVAPSVLRLGAATN